MSSELDTTTPERGRGRSLHFVIIGAGMAGGNAARALREEGFDGRITLIGDEPGVPFGRPPLSKTYLRGEEGLSGWLVMPPDWYATNGIEQIHGSVDSIDVVRRRVQVDRAAVEYSKLLIATGGRNRKIDIAGAELEGIYQLRTVASCDAIKREAQRGAHALIVGMGFIGSEVAASLRQLGVNVTAVFPGKHPLVSVLGPEMGAVMGGIHLDAGVELVAEDAVARFEGSKRVERAVLKSGRSIDCDMAVVAVGITPNIEVARDADIAVDNGILVDGSCRTSAEHVFAAGDVANHLHPLFGRVRVEHYNNAEKQGAAAARSMLDVTEYRYLHTFWSDQYTDKLEYAGHATRWDRFVVRGSLEDHRLVGFYLDGGVVKAAVGFNRGGDPELEPDSEMAAAAQLVAMQARPDPAALADETRGLFS